jgi:hypothetical protein
MGPAGLISSTVGRLGNGLGLSKPTSVIEAGATAYTYYRFRATDENYAGGARWGVTEIKGYESNDNTGDNVFNTLYVSALGSSGTDSDQSAFDEDTGTYWDTFNKTPPDYQNIYVRMSAAKAIRSITFDHAPFGWVAKQFVVEGSDDAASWTVLATINHPNDASPQNFTDIQ